MKCNLVVLHANETLLTSTMSIQKDGSAWELSKETRSCLFTATAKWGDVTLPPGQYRLEGMSRGACWVMTLTPTTRPSPSRGHGQWCMMMTHPGPLLSASTDQRAWAARCMPSDSPPPASIDQRAWAVGMITDDSPLPLALPASTDRFEMIHFWCGLKWIVV